MLTPEQIQKIADTMFPMLDSLNARILRDMIKRLAARIGRGEQAMLTATDEWQAQVYQESGGLLEAGQWKVFNDNYSVMGQKGKKSEAQKICRKFTNIAQIYDRISGKKWKRRRGDVGKL